MPQQQLYQWEVSQKKRMPDGSVKNITAKQVGPKPPHAAKNVRRVGSPDPVTDRELQQLEEKEAAEKQAALERHEKEKAHKQAMKEENRKAAEKLQRAAGDPPAAVNVTEDSETITEDVNGKPIEKIQLTTADDDAGSSEDGADPLADDDAGSSEDETPVDDVAALKNLRKPELAELAEKRGVKVKSKATKADIIAAIQVAE